MKAICVPLVVAGVVSLSGCGERNDAGPPTIRLGDSVCDECNMIISDERWATATIVAGPRGSEPRLFDDFNCQVGYEVEHTNTEILARWSHDHATGEWVSTEQAFFLISGELRTPMGSMVAAFTSEPGAEAASLEWPGEVLTFEAAWKRLGFVEARIHTDGVMALPAEQEHTNGP